jgi:hypothetical protein
MSDAKASGAGLPPRSDDRFPMIRRRTPHLGLFETPDGDHLKAAIEILYFAFASADLNPDFAGCPHCFTFNDLEFLRRTHPRKFSLDDIGFIFTKSMSTLGTAKDLNHFVPRILEAWALNALDAEELLPHKLVAARSSGWSTEQLAAVVQFMRSMFAAINARTRDLAWPYLEILDLEELRAALPEAADALIIGRTSQPAELDLSSLACFDFESAPLSDDTMVVTCRRVWEERRPIAYVSREDDGQFQFICDGDEHTTVAEVVYIHAGHIFELGPDQLRDFSYLREGCSARHLHDDVWQLGQITPASED